MKKKILLVFLLLLMLMIPTASVSAASVTASGSCGTNLTWSLTDDGTLTISGTGTMTEFASSSVTPWYDYRTTITEVIIKNGVSSIGSYAFMNCKTIETISIPSSIASVGKYAFAYCEALESAVIPKGVTTINTHTFYCCYGITDISLPDSLTSIDEYAFYKCTSLTSIDIPEGITTISSKMFYGDTLLADVTIPESVTSIKNDAFTSCKALESINIPKKVTSIGNNAFNYCSALIEVWYGGTASDWSNISIGTSNDPLKNAVIHFSGTEYLANGTCGDALTWTLYHDGTLAIKGTGAMYDYTSGKAPWYTYRNIIKSITLEKGITTIGAYTFYLCRNLQMLEVPKGVTTIGKCALYSCNSLTELHIPKSVTSIGDSNFYGCSALTDIYYGSSESDWGKITLGSGNSTHLNNVNIHYTDNLCGEDVFWVFDAATGTLTISGTGDMWKYSVSHPWNNYADQIKTVIIEDGITNITDYAFMDYTNLKTVQLPNSITSIENFVFCGCTSLESITVPQGITSFGTHLFSRCTALKEVSLPSTLTSISQSAFLNCSSLTSIAIPNGVTAIGERAFAQSGIETITIPANVSTLENNAFYSCSALRSVTFKTEKLQTIAEDTFYKCESLTEIEIPNGVTTIEDYAFKQCENLKTIILPVSVTSVGNYAFDQCYAIDDVYYGGTEEEWNKITFGAYNTFLTSATIHYAAATSGTCGDNLTWELDTKTGVLTISGTGRMSNFDNAPWDAYKSSITSVVLPDGLTSIGNSAFYSCNNLKQIVIPESVTSFGDEAFEGCKSLTKINLPNNLKTIGERTFFGCTGLTEITIPEGVTKISFSAFNGCSKLKTVNLPLSVKTVATYAFSGCSSLSDVYYAGSKINWNGISITPDNTSLTNATIHYAIPSGTAGDNITWELDLETGTLTFSGTGELVGGPTAEWYTDHVADIRKIVIGEGITSIADRAFSCDGGTKGEYINLTTLEMADTITSIGSEAFEDCSALKNITWSQNLKTIGSYAFEYTALTDVILPDSVTAINAGAFRCCSNLESITFSKNVTYIGQGMFYGCTSFSDVYYGGSILDWKTIGIGMSNEDLTNATIHYAIPSGKCGDNLFWVLNEETGVLTISGTGEMDADFSTYAPWSDHMEEITSVVIEDDVTSIGSFAFLDCNYLKEVTISDSVTSIGKGAFMSCNALENVTLPDGLTSLSDQIFQDCEALTEITIPDGVTSIGVYAFAYCYSLTAVTIPDDVTSIGEGAFGCCHAMTEVTIPKSVTTIDYYAFYYCSALSDVYYDGTKAEWNAISIGTDNEDLLDATLHCVTPTSGKCGENLTWEFNKATGTLTISGTGPMYTYDEDDEYEDYSPWLGHKDSITSVVFPEGITEIGYCAFYNHDGITSVTIPNSVTSIKDSAFASCSNLETVDLGDGCSLREDAFYLTPVKNLNLGSSSYFGPRAFSSGSLTSITIAANNPSFADGAFWSCENLKDVHFKGSAPSSVTDKGIMLSNTLSSFRDDVVWYYDCGQSGWLTSNRYNATSKTWAGYTLVSENHAHKEIITAPTCTEQGYTSYKCPCGDSYIDINTYVPEKGHTEVIDNAVESTCTETGLSEGKHCSVCGEVTVAQEITPVKGHTEVIDKAVEPTCTGTGLTEGKHCDVCDKVLTAQEIIPAKDHDYTGKITTEANCQKEGVMTYTCQNDTSHTYTEAIPKKDHTEVTIEGEEATCTETGTTDGKYCSVCRTMLTLPEVIPAKGHTEVIDAAVEPTCTETGLTEGKHCSVCSEVLVAQEVVPVKEHTEVIDNAKEPTCTETGLTEGSHCDVCGKVLTSQETIPEIGHDYVGNVTTESTCETEGVMTYTCQNDSSHTYTEAIPKKDHTEVTIKGKEATCTETGKTDMKYCSVCGTVTVVQEIIPAKNHTEVIDKGKEPTCTETGLTEGKHCDVCNEVLVKQEVIPVKEHTEVTDAGKESTCTETGLTEGKHCDICGEVTVAQTVIPKKDHTEVTDAGKEPTCTETGLTEGKHCSVCGEITVPQTEIPATGHTFTETFQWADDLTSATAVLACDCGHSEEYPCELTWDNSQSSRLTVTAVLEANGQTFSESKEISAVKEGNSITLTFDAVYSGLKISAAAYNNNGQMTAYTVPESIGKTVTLHLSGDQVHIFFMTGKYCPISPFLQV